MRWGFIARWLFPDILKNEQEMALLEMNLRAAQELNEKQRLRSREASREVVDKSERIKSLTSEVLDDIHASWRNGEDHA